jgi:hypothetical protein
MISLTGFAAHSEEPLHTDRRTRGFVPIVGALRCFLFVCVVLGSDFA